MVPQFSGSRSFFFFQAEDGIRDDLVTGVQTCALPIWNLLLLLPLGAARAPPPARSRSRFPRAAPRRVADVDAGSPDPAVLPSRARRAEPRASRGDRGAHVLRGRGRLSLDRPRPLEGPLASPAVPATLVHSATVASTAVHRRRVELTRNS